MNCPNCKTGYLKEDDAGLTVNGVRMIEIYCTDCSYSEITEDMYSYPNDYEDDYERQDFYDKKYY